MRGGLSEYPVGMQAVWPREGMASTSKASGGVVRPAAKTTRCDAEGTNLSIYAVLRPSRRDPLRAQSHVVGKSAAAMHMKATQGSNNSSTYNIDTL